MRGVRDGLPLPGTTPAQVLSQLAHRVSGPLRTEQARTLLDYHGVGGEPAGTVAQVAARHAVSGRTLSNWVAALRAAGSRLPLSAELITQMTRRSAEGEDHLGRVRTSKAFGVPPPARPLPPHPSRVGSATTADRPAAAIACRVLAAAGPQPLTILRTAVLRARRFRDRRPLTGSQLTDALLALGATVDADGRWQPPPGTPVPPRYRNLVTVAAGRELTRTEMVAALVDAGYGAAFAEDRCIRNHPLIRHVGRDSYRLVGNARRPDDDDRSFRDPRPPEADRREP